MENNRPLKPIFLLTMGMIITFPLFVFAYSDDTTHPGLTSETVKFFNTQYSNLKLSDAEKELLMKGSKEEDHGARAMHHFYDPIYERGITIKGVGEWQKSKDWAKDTLAQASYAFNFVSNPTEKMLYGTVREFFEGDTDYSWDRAVYEYAWGDKERGLEALGHVIHLIQDSSVPDHTRNDPHPPAFHFGSPFEKWAEQFGPENIDVVSKLKNKKPAKLSSLDEYFNSVANYSNNNFFSKDTVPNINSDYTAPTEKFILPEILSNGEFGSFAYNTVHGNPYKLALIKTDGILFSKEYFIKDNDNLILSDYWNLLSQQAVLHGAGVIKLFFDEVEKEKETRILYNKNKNWFQKFYDATQGKIFNIAGALYGSSLTFEELQELTGDENGSAEVVPPAAEPVAPPQVASEEIQAEEPEEVADSTKSQTGESENVVTDVSVQKNDTIEQRLIPNNDESEPSRTPTPHSPSVGGGSAYGAAPEAPQNSADSTQSNAETVSEVVPPPLVSSPALSSWRIATTTITFSGNASSTLTVATDHSSATTSPDGSENWSLAFSDLTEGENTFQFWTKNSSNATSTKVSKTITVDLTAPSITAFTILQCTYSLATSICLSGGSAANISWSSSATDISYFAIAKDGVVVATTSASAYDLALSNGTYAIAVGAYDTAGNAATSSTKSITVFQNPLVINEIAWAGTEASASDEWIELYNRSSYTIDLSRVSLLASDGVPTLALSGIATSSDYYLIERTDDTTTSVNADLVTAFSGSGTGSGLSNDGEVLSLAHYLGGLATTTLDSTPALADCSGTWCAGSAVGTTTSMERVSASGSGSIKTNWQSNNTYTKNGTDANGNALHGTPASQNSVSILSVGYYCPPYTATFTEGGYYIPTGSLCTYLSSSITSGTRYGDLYKGTVASSTIINGHSLSSNATSTQPNDTLPSPVQGDRFFTAIYKVRSSADDITDFRNYFKTGANPPPHLEYGVINWLYGAAP